MRKILLIVLVILNVRSFSQIPSFYYTRFGGNDDDVGNCIIQSLNGGYVIVGQTNSFGASQTDIYVSKTNNLAAPIWQKNFGGVLSDVGKSIVELNDSSLIIVGYTSSFGNGGYDAYIFKADKNGNVIWEKTFGGSDWDFAYSVNKTNDGNIIICGSTYSYGRGNNDGFILKMDYNGNFLWNKIYGGKSEDDFKEIIQTVDGGYIATGTTKSYGDSLGDIWVAKFDANGDSSWFTTRGGNKKEIGNSIVQNANQDYFVAGGSESYGVGMEDAYVFKLSVNGNFMWQRTEGLSNEDEEAYSVKNSYSIIGGIVFCFTTEELFGFGKDSKTLLYDASGSYVNGGRVGSPQEDEAFSVANCKDKGYIITGYTEGFGSPNGLKDIFVVKFDSLMNGPGSLILELKENALGNEHIKIYPNPFAQELLVESPQNDPLNMVRISDLHGRIVLEQKCSKNRILRLDGLNFLPGIYVISVITESTNYTYKVFCNR